MRAANQCVLQNNQFVKNLNFKITYGSIMDDNRNEVALCVSKMVLQMATDSYNFEAAG